ncbi:MAG: ABC transporter ATP-binding protein [Erysipelotrichia bacterium]|jgi:ABC-type bacteriocin/lantibiotic exporter with double-glycine peptidase domain|nr:ABC transporter ATP-binding protein [Erysipelotrichia bacterium]
MKTLMQALPTLLLGVKRSSLIALLFVAILSALLSSLSIALIFPFMNVALDSSLIETTSWMSQWMSLLNLSTSSQFLVSFGLLLLLVIVLANMFSILNVKQTSVFVASNEAVMSTRLFEAYMRQPYRFFVAHHSSELSKNILNEVSELNNRLIVSFIDIIVSLIMLISILLMLLIVDTNVTLLVGVVVMGLYALLARANKLKTRSLGRERYAINQQRFKVVNDALTSIKIAKVMGLEPSFIESFNEKAKRQADIRVKFDIMMKVPYFYQDLFAFGSIVSVVVIFSLLNLSLTQTLPLLSVFAISAYRLKPVLNRLFVSFSAIGFSDATYHKIQAHLDLPSYPLPNHDIQPLPFDDSIEFRDVCFSYHEDKPILDHVNVTIHKGETLGIVGSTGSGKTTMMDILLGLLSPTSGHVLIDGVKCDEVSTIAWQANLGYVPQDVVLIDASIAANIALGAEVIDFNRVIEVAKMTQMHEFIITQTSDGYDTMIGERGVRLSGGQRQRLGLARALYRGVNTLVLDEATSALDGATEKEVLHALRGLKGQLTLIMVAHRFNTLVDCDRILVLKEGKIVDSGTYDYLLQHNADFRNLAQIKGSEELS